jgi:hypothetical protein
MAAQSAVKAQFDWAMARDDQPVDIRRLVGVQVKAGVTPFKRAVTVDGLVIGWWYYERNDHHSTDRVTDQ